MSITLILLSSLVVPLVSKMFFYEAAHVFWSTCTMIFRYHEVFRRFTVTNQAYLGRLKKVRIIVNQEFRFAQTWGNVLNSESIALLKGLKGVDLEIARNEMANIFTEEDVMKSKGWLRTGIPKIIRSFKQHKLEREQVVVVFVPPWRTDAMSRARMKNAADRVREELLAYKPLRKVRNERKRSYEDIDSDSDE
jgi:hypothetical protein